ncbi:unnamed protein product [Lactuca virosa]|uniref:PB1 domain-containing protein n=1 Tax=Lactuca virosa TaxID=75947 RepID=A0AAU9MM46_9ASTR|nr:unnamed protein product [Lactuca virosa]
MADYTTGQKELVGLPSDDESPYEASPSPIDDRLSTFLETFTAQLHYSQPVSKRGLFVFWSQNLSSQSNRYSDNRGLVLDITDPWEIQTAIKSAFCKVELCCFDGLIQFWAPVETSSRRLLTTYDQPFALKYLDSGLQKYRLFSLKYQYNIDANKLEVGDDTMIISGAPANAFINHLAEIFLDMRVYHGINPLVRSALECELMSCFLLPICDPSQSRCVGVVECSSNKLDDLLEIFKDLNSALEKVGLSTFHGQERMLYKSIVGLKHVTDEVEEALQRVCESHDLTLAQLWISYEDDNSIPFSTSLENTHMKRIIPLKLIAHCDNLDDEDHLSFKDYYAICDMLPLQIGEGLVGKAFQNYEPHLCRNIYEMSNNELSLLFPITITERSCFVICLRSIETGNLDYVFEFLWLQSRNYIILLESIILTLKRCLPNFKFSSGSQLGDELHVVDFKFNSGVEFGDELSVQDFTFAFGAELGDVNFSKSGIEYFKIFEGKKSSPIPTVLEKGMRLVAEECIGPLDVKCKTTEKPLPRGDIEQQFGRTMKEAAKNLNVSLSTLKRKCRVHGISEWKGPSFGNRKINYSYQNRSDMNEEDNGAIQGPRGIVGDTVIIKAEYEDDVIKFHLPISLTTLEAVEKEIGKRFKLKVTTYKLKYQDEDKEWILMTSDQDMSDCIKISRSVNDTRIKLRVLGPI